MMCEMRDLYRARIIHILTSHILINLNLGLVYFSKVNMYNTYMRLWIRVEDTHKFPYY